MIYKLPKAPTRFLTQSKEMFVPRHHEFLQKTKGL